MLESEPEPEPEPEPQPDPEPEPEMVAVMPLAALQERGGLVLRPAADEGGMMEGGPLHPMARGNPLGRHTGPPVEVVDHPSSPVPWAGPAAVALFALPGGGVAAIENACPRK
eukprot:COSAG06_NODE_1651_length_8804_cov_4.320620_7_plen_112_part_00